MIAWPVPRAQANIGHKSPGLVAGPDSLQPGRRVRGNTPLPPDGVGKALRESKSPPRRGAGPATRATSPGWRWLAPEAGTLVREALRGVLDGLARKPPVVGALAAGRVRDALAVLPKEE